MQLVTLQASSSCQRPLGLRRCRHTKSSEGRVPNCIRFIICYANYDSSHAGSRFPVPKRSGADLHSPARLTAGLLTAAIKRAKSLHELVTTCLTHFEALNHIHVSAAFSAAVKLPGNRRGLGADGLDTLLTRFSDLLPDASAREISAVLWSLAKLGRPLPQGLLDSVLAEQQHRGVFHDAAPQSLANILWALSHWRNAGPDPLLTVLLTRCEAVLPAFQPQDTANVLTALAWLQRRPGPLLAGLTSLAARQAPQTTPQGLANAVWACRRLRHYDAGFLHAAAASFLVQLPAATAVDVGLFTSSLAGLRYRSPELLRAVARQCCAELCPPAAATARDRVFSVGATVADTTTGASPGTSSSGRARYGTAADGGGNGTSSTSGRDMGDYHGGINQGELGGSGGGGSGGGGSGGGGSGGGGSGGGGSGGGGSGGGGSGGGGGPGTAAIDHPHGASGGVAAAKGWTARERLQVLWSFATLEFRDLEAVAALLGPPVSDPGACRAAAWPWEPGGLQPDEPHTHSHPSPGLDPGPDNGPRPSAASGSHQRDSGSVAHNGVSAAGGSDVKAVDVRLGASSFIWCMAKLGCGRSPGRQQAAVLAAVEAMWAARGRLGLTHLAPAVWGLERLGLPDQRLLALAAQKLAAALEGAPHSDNGGVAAEGAVGAEGGAIGPRSVPAPRLLSAGELNATVTVLWCLGRRGVADDRVLDAFARQAPRLMPRLDTRQLPLVCCAYVQLGRTDAEVMGCAAELLLRGTAPRPKPGLGLGLGLDLGSEPERGLHSELRPDLELDVAEYETEWALEPGLELGLEAQRAEDEGEAASERGVPAGAALERGARASAAAKSDGVASEVAGGSDFRPAVGAAGATWQEAGAASGGADLGVMPGSGDGGGSGSSSRRRSRQGSGGSGSGGEVLLDRLPCNGLAMSLWALAAAGQASPQLMQRAAPAVLRLFPPAIMQQRRMRGTSSVAAGDEGQGAAAGTASGAFGEVDGATSGGAGGEGDAAVGVEGGGISPASILADRSQMVQGSPVPAEAALQLHDAAEGAAATAAPPRRAGWPTEAGWWVEAAPGARDGGGMAGGKAPSGDGLVRAIRPLAAGAGEDQTLLGGSSLPEENANNDSSNTDSGTLTGGDTVRCTASTVDTTTTATTTTGAAAGPSSPAPSTHLGRARWAALILWAFAASDCYNVVLYDTLLSYMQRKMSELGPGRLAMVLWAAAVSGHYRRDAAEQLCGALQGCLERLPPASFTQANWAVAHLTAGLCLSWRGPSPSLLVALAPRLSRHQAAVLLWTLALQQLVMAGEGQQTGPRERGQQGGARPFCGVLGRLMARLRQPAARAQTEEVEAAVEAEVEVEAEVDSADTAVALIVAEALALLLLSPHPAVRAWAEGSLAGPPLPLEGPGSQPAAGQLQASPGTDPDPGTSVEEQTGSQAAGESGAEAVGGGNGGGGCRQREWDQRQGREHFASSGGADSGEGARSGHRPVRRGGGRSSRSQSRGTGDPPAADVLAGAATLGSQLSDLWLHSLRRRHPLQGEVAAAARQLGYSPRLLRTHALLPLGLAAAVELPDAAPGPAVLLLADLSDFASNVAGQPLGPLFVTVQLLKERGWLVAVVVAPQFASMRMAKRRAAYLRQLLAAAGVTGGSARAPVPALAAAAAAAGPAAAAAGADAARGAAIVAVAVLPAVALPAASATAPATAAAPADPGTQG